MRQSSPDDSRWEEFAAELGRNLQRARIRAGLSQEHVAYSAGLSRYTYQKYEKGQSRPGTAANPSLRALLAIAQSLGEDLSGLLPEKLPDLRAR